MEQSPNLDKSMNNEDTSDSENHFDTNDLVDFKITEKKSPWNSLVSLGEKLYNIQDLRFSKPVKSKNNLILSLKRSQFNDDFIKNEDMEKLLFTVVKVNFWCTFSIKKNSSDKIRNSFKSLIQKINLKENFLKYDHASWNESILMVTKHNS